MAVTFEDTIKSYFTPCYRAHMIAALDLWEKGAVAAEWNQIRERCARPAGQAGSMPAPGCPEGVWDDPTRAQFLVDFQAWKDAGFP